MEKRTLNNKLFVRLSLLLLAAVFLTACGVVPPSNYGALSTDGSKLFVANANFVYAVNPGTGSIEWKFPPKPDQYTYFFGAPALADGWAYAGSYDNVAYGFSLATIGGGDVTPTWSYTEHKGKGRFIGGPAAAGDLVLFPSTDHYLYAIDRKAGTLRWRFETRGALWAPAAASEDGNIAYQAGLDHYLYAFNLETGKLQYELDLGGPVVGGFTKDGDILYVGTLNDEMLAVDSAKGRIIWRTALEGKVWSAPLLHEGKLYFGTDSKKIYIVDAAKGSELKKIDTAGPVIAAPVYTDGAMVFVNENGEVFALTPDGENRPWTRTLTKGKVYSTPVVVNNQIVFTPFQGEHVLAGFDFSGNPDAKWDSVEPK